MSDEEKLTAFARQGSHRRLYDAEHRIESARLYGDVTTYQYYYTNILVGSPLPQRVSVIADTGSTICAFTCKGCQSCGQHLDANFDFSLSTTAEWTLCSKGCSSCRQNRCAYRQSYTEGSSIEGFQFTDFMSLGDEFQENPMVKVRMGCHTRETRLFVTQKANGIMGLAPADKPTVLQEIFKDVAHVNGAIFSMCLSTQGGLLTVGYNASLSGVSWIPMRLGRFYSVSLKQISLGPGDNAVLSGFGHTFVDSGTTYTYLPDGLFRALRDKVTKHCGSAGSGCGQVMGSTCWKLPGESALSRFPQIFFTFGENTLVTWPPSSYLFQKSAASQLYCLGFQSNGAVAETVLGATFMINQLVIFDTQSKRLGLVSSSCPSFTQRPRAPQKLRKGDPGPATTPGSRAASDAGTVFALVSLLLILLGLCLVARNLLRAYGLGRRETEGGGGGVSGGTPVSPRRSAARARKLGKAADEELQSLAEGEAEPRGSPRRPEEVTRIPLEAWLNTGSESPTAGSGDDTER